MKRILLFLSALFIATTAIAHTINWYVDGNIFHTTTCESGENVTPPTAPEKYGYTFKGWDVYTPIEYLESTGEQWIRTDIALCTGYTVEAKYKLNTGGRWTAVYGSGAPQFQFTQNIETKYIVLGYSNKEFSGWTDLAYPSNTWVQPDTEIHTIRQENNKYYMDGILFYTMPEATVLPGRKAYLFSRNAHKTDENIADCRLYGRIYYVKIWDNNILVRDFIPVLDKNGVPCMYDKVEYKFYYNAGTGDFIAGPIVGE